MIENDQFWEESILSVYYVNSDVKKIKLSSLLDYYKLDYRDGWIYNYNFFNKIYYLENSKDVYFTDNLKNISKICQLEIDEEVEFYYKNTGLIIPPFTIYKNIYRISPYTMFRIENNRIIIKDIFPKSGKNKLDEERFEQIIERSLYKLKNTSKNIITLSGGADSSLLTAISYKNNINAKTITCLMDGLEQEYNKAKKISDQFNYFNIKYIPDNKKLNSIVQYYISNSFEPVFDSIYPVMTNMLENMEYVNILDGQGADSILMGLPHNRLVGVYKNYMKFFRPLGRVFEKFAINKGSKLGRYVFRIQKALSSLAHTDVYECLLSSLNFPIIKDSNYYMFVYKKLTEINEHYKDIHKMVSYFFTFKIISIREMQKYESLISNKKNVILPFLEDAMINYIFSLDTSELIDKYNIKKPIYDLIDKYLPGIIKRNQTSPFFVKYKHNHDYKYDNVFNGKKYCIRDVETYNFASMVIEDLKKHIGTSNSNLHARRVIK